MDAFSALSANLAPTVPSPAANVASSPTTDKSFASHLQSASRQQRTGQHSEIPAGQAEAQAGPPQAEQTTEAATTQALASEIEQENHDPAEADNNTTTGAMNVDFPAMPAQPVHAETVAAASASAPPNAIAATATTAVTRLLDAITATTPATANAQGEAAKLPQPTPLPSPTSTTVVTATQQIIVEDAALATATSPATTTLIASTPPPTTMPAAQPPTLQGTQLPGQTVAPLGTLPGQSPSIVVQSVTEAQNTAILPTGPGSLPQSDMEPGAPLVVQNQYGQIITIEQNSALAVASESQAATQMTPFAGTTDSDMDLTNQYIHSHLPNETAAKGEESGNRSTMGNDGGQSMPQNQTGQQTEAPATTEPTLAVKTLTTTGQESQPLIFSHQQSSGLTSAPLSTSTTTTGESSLYRLPSGTAVPESAVIDQMITHFSINKRLETGTVNLRLHPQELGELRMEIRVEQDNVKAHIVAQSPHAQEMIDRHLPKLREALEQQGLHLGQVEVTVAANDNAAGETFQENTSWQQSQRSLSSKQSQANFTMEGIDEELAPTAEVDNNLSVIA